MPSSQQYSKSKLLNVAGVSTDQTVEIISDTMNQLVFWVSWANGSSPVATISITDSGSSDEDLLRGTATWTALTLSGTPAISGASGSHKITLSPYAAKRTRLTVDFTSGSCDLVVDALGTGGG